MKSAYDEAVRLLPSKTAAALGERFKAAEEFRLRAGRYPSALIGGREEVIADKAVTCDDIACVLEKATNASLHSVWQDMSRGFISCGFGLRIGVCGTGVISSGKLTGLRDISSVSIRIPKQTTECGGEILKKLCTAKDNVLIISPPGGGKTTFLRECIRVISSSGVRVAVCDERSELAAVFRDVRHSKVRGSAYASALHESAGNSYGRDILAGGLPRGSLRRRMRSARHCNGARSVCFRP